MTAVRSLLPGRIELVPWTDKKGRLDWLRATVFTLLLAPAVWLAARWWLDMLGPRSVNAAIHSTGYTAVWLLLASLVVTPFKALSGNPRAVVVRRMIGNAALGYALLHLGLYVVEQNWRWMTVVTEIVSRVYLTIGFVALLGLVVLGVTSTDGWVKQLGTGWKRLHRVVYAIMALGLVHYVLQSKLDVSQALVASGVFAWLMGWRLLPAGRDRTWRPLLGLSLAAGLATLAMEYLWYRFGTRIDPWKVVASEVDVMYGLRPAGEVLAIGLLATLATVLRQMAPAPPGGSFLFTVAVYALGGLVDEAAALALGWSLEDAAPEAVGPAGMAAAWFVLLALLGVARWLLRDRWHRHLVDAIWLACLAEHILVLGLGRSEIGLGAAGVVTAFALVIAARLWPVSRGAALAMVPLAALLAIEAAFLP